MSGVVVTCCSAAVSRPATSAAAAALRIRLRSMAASVAGQAEGVARVVRGVMDRRRIGKTGAEDNQQPQGERQESWPARDGRRFGDGRGSEMHETSLPSLRRQATVPARAGLL